MRARHLAASSIALVLTASACAPRAAAPRQAGSPPPTRTAPAHEAPCPRAETLEAAAIEREAVCLLRRYIQLDTTNPPGNEIAAARFLRGVLARDGIDAQIIESEPGRANIYARLRGEPDTRALVLMHHMDVVPASADRWSVPPLSGELRDGYVWGRGSFDNKGGGIAQLMSLLMLKRLGLPLPRDLVLLGVADEEAGGEHGVRFLLDQHFALFENVGYVLTEGGGIRSPEKGAAAYSVEVAQKAPLWLRITAQGEAGHASAPHAGASTHNLIRALSRLEAHRFPITVLPEVQEHFNGRARSMPEPQKERYMDLEASLRDPEFRREFLADPRQAALVRNTLSITMLHGSDKENVLPPQASAVLDLRLLPGQEPAAVTAELEQVMGEPSLRIETLLSWRAAASSRETPLFFAIEELARQRDGGASVSATVLGGFTDCNAFRLKGITCYGFIPLRFTLDEIKRIHGNDERIPTAALGEGTLALIELVSSLFGSSTDR